MIISFTRQKKVKNNHKNHRRRVFPSRMLLNQCQLEARTPVFPKNKSEINIINLRKHIVKLNK